MPSSRTCVGVVFGGASGEHTVSIQSAKTVVKALRTGANKSRFEVIPIYVDRQGSWHETAIAYQVLGDDSYTLQAKLASKKNISGFQGLPHNTSRIDVWYPVMHGPNGEDGTMQGLFKLMKKPFVGSGVLGSALAMDKLAMKAAFKAAEIPQVPYLGVKASQLSDENYIEELIKKLEERLSYPCFVKPANLGSSVGITKAFNKQEVLNGLTKAAKFDQRIVIEKGLIARELECAALGHEDLKLSVVGEVRFDSDWYDYETKYSEGRTTTIIPAAIPKSLEDEIHKQTKRACQALSVSGMARVDFFYEECIQKIWINEVNTLPGFTHQSMYPMLWRASGVTLEELVCQLVEAARE
ncbi:D-alanine--D-alanine ligase family protein [Prochlorococcus sp. MIT 1300]|uniref:D-alanine--D-alanine ligase family protein n=1 Tax=Prochlorococcus sp. MIT 1300 TaxID=3096218 RepID=UPI002A74A8A6|nr:D-alanine--D-alanine ligase family protein [Prochlorococcus sp. MIT 1300]